MTRCTRRPPHNTRRHRSFLPTDAQQVLPALAGTPSKKTVIHTNGIATFIWADMIAKEERTNSNP